MHPTAAKKMKERRRFERYSLTLPARLESDGGAGGIPEGLMTSNISAGGAYVMMTEPLTQGMEVRMEVILPFNNLKKVKVEKDACVMITGTVVRAEEAGIAVQFNDDCSIMPVS
jgi:hypothetical protein